MSNDEHGNQALHENHPEYALTLREEYPDRLWPLLVELAGYNRDEWLTGEKAKTYGAENVRETGLTQAQQALADDLADRLAKFEAWACDECGVRKATCTRGSTALCNDCAFEP